MIYLTLVLSCFYTIIYQFGTNHLSIPISAFVWFFKVASWRYKHVAFGNIFFKNTQEMQNGKERQCFIQIDNLWSFQYSRTGMYGRYYGKLEKCLRVLQESHYRHMYCLLSPPRCSFSQKMKPMNSLATTQKSNTYWVKTCSKIFRDCHSFKC